MVSRTSRRPGRVRRAAAKALRSSGSHEPLLHGRRDQSASPARSFDGNLAGTLDDRARQPQPGGPQGRVHLRLLQVPRLVHRDADSRVVEILNLASVLDGDVHDASLEANQAAGFGRR